MKMMWNRTEANQKKNEEFNGKKIPSNSYSYTASHIFQTNTPKVL